MKGRIKCKRKDRPYGHSEWHSAHAAEHCRGIICRWFKRGQGQRCPMRSGRYSDHEHARNDSKVQETRP